MLHGWFLFLRKYMLLLLSEKGEEEILSFWAKCTFKTSKARYFFK
jgi:hypothetical protein